MSESFAWLLPFVFCFSWSICVSREAYKVITRKLSCGWRELIRRGAARYPEGIGKDTAATTPCSPRHDASPLGVGGPEPSLPPKDVAGAQYTFGTTDYSDCQLYGEVEPESVVPLLCCCLFCVRVSSLLAHCVSV